MMKLFYVSLVLLILVSLIPKTLAKEDNEQTPITDWKVGASDVKQVMPHPNLRQEVVDTGKGPKDSHDMPAFDYQAFEKEEQTHVRKVKCFFHCRLTLWEMRVRTRH